MVSIIQHTGRKQSLSNIINAIIPVDARDVQDTLLFLVLWDVGSIVCDTLT